MQTCQVCGKQNPAGVEYCEDCGASLRPASGQAPAGPQVAGTSGPVAPPVVTTAPPVGAAPRTDAAPGVAPELPTAGVPPLAEGAAAVMPPTPVTGAATGAATGDATAPAPPAPQTAPQPPAPQAAGAAVSDVPASPAGLRPRLVAKRFGALTGEEIPLLAQRLVVGRFDPETGPVDVDLSGAPGSEHISRQHAELYREGDGPWLVRDLGSTNGVFVKGGREASFGPRITAPRPLRWR